MFRRVMLAAVVVSTLCGGRSASAAGPDWGTYRGDAQHTGRSDVSFDPRALQSAWTSPEGFRNPVIAGDIVYAHKWQQSGSPIGAVTAFDRLTGAVRWTAGGQFRRVSPVTVAHGLAVYEATDSGASDPQFVDALWVHDAASGALKYRVPLGGVDVSDAPTLTREPDGSVGAYLTSSGMRAFTLGETSATHRWSTGDGFSLYSTAAIAGGSAVGGNFGNALAFDRATGEANRFYNIGATGGQHAGVSYDQANARLYVNAGPAGLRAFSYGGQNDITPLWTTSTFHGDQPVTIGADGKLYAIDASTEQVVEIDGATGQVLRRSTADDFLGLDTPVIHDGYLWVSAVRSRFDQELRVLDLTTLETVRTFPAGDSPDGVYFAPPALAEGTAVLPFQSGVSDWRGFTVYIVPEPALLAPAVALLAALSRPRRRR